MFPPEIIKAACLAEQTTHCPAILTLAQWALESGYGKFDMGALNYFGIKWHPACPYPYIVKPTKEFEGGHWIVIEAKFIRFPSMQACFEYHGRMLFEGPYAKCSPVKGDALSFLTCVAPIYATDPNYKLKLLSIIKHNNLVELCDKEKATLASG